MKVEYLWMHFETANLWKFFLPAFLF